MAVKNTSTTSLSPNLASALCYIPVVGWLAALVLLVVEKQASVRWNAIQALVLTGVSLVLVLALVSTIILAWVVPFVNIAVLVLNLILAVKSYQGSAIKLPLLGDWTDKITKKV